MGLFKSPYVKIAILNFYVQLLSLSLSLKAIKINKSEEPRPTEVVAATWQYRWTCS